MTIKKYKNGGWAEEFGTGHSQIDNIIEENDTLLGLVTGGEYQTSEDLPPLSTTGKITNENLKDAWRVTQGAFSLDAISPKMAGSMLPLWKKGFGKPSKKGYKWLAENINKMDQEILKNDATIKMISEKMKWLKDSKSGASSMGNEGREKLINLAWKQGDELVKSNLGLKRAKLEMSFQLRSAQNPRK
jgi:hypothetical protein